MLAMRLVPMIAVLCFATGPAATAGPTGAYRLTADFGGDSFTALVSFTTQGNLVAGQFLGSLDLPSQLKPTIRDVRVIGDRLRFTLVLAGSQTLTFDGKLPAARGPIPGSLTAGETIVTVLLEPSVLTAFDRTALLKEIAATAPSGALLYAAVVELLDGATAAKTPLPETQSWADRAAKAAEPFGVRWQMHVLLRMARALVDQPAYNSIALSLARRAEQLLDAADDITVHLTVLDLYRRLLTQGADAATAASVQTRIDGLEARDYRDYLAASPLRPDLYAGRKANSNRVVLAELFGGSDDPPSAAAELAFDALGRVFKPIEVVRLEYHLNQPDPDPLGNKAANARWAYYQARLGGAAGIPAFFVNGKPGAPGGGPAEVAATKLKQYRALIEPQLDTAPAAALQLTATRMVDKITIIAKVTGLARPADSVRLRLAVAETVVRYRGENGLRYHQCVVRGFAGPPDGVPLPRPALDYQATADVAAMRFGLSAELDELVKKNAGLSFFDRPLGMRSLIIVGFVQDDVSHEVLQAAQVEVR
jgi:hypothetical protein